MLLQFSTTNYKTFKEKAVLNLTASNYDKDVLEEDNIISIPTLNLRVLKSAVLYGANSSGKSKFIEALAFMADFAIFSSMRGQKGDFIDVDPFKLEAGMENEPSEFEIIFLHEKEIFRYGFSALQTRIVEEWLYHKPKTKELQLFYRQNQEFEFHKRNFSKGVTLVKEDLIRENALMLSVAAQFNDRVCGRVIEWFKKLRIISGLREDGYQAFTMGKTEDANQKAKILELLKIADLGIDDITLERLDPSNLPKNLSEELREHIVKVSKEQSMEFVKDVLTTHKKYDKEQVYVGDVNFSLDEDESSGTKKFFALTGPVLDSIEHGHTLVIDEFDSKLHPNLVCKIVSLFNSKELNPLNAQLIFNTHDTNLLSSGLFRRDQIWFTEKDRFGVSSLYSLSDFKSEVRKNHNFETNYIQGRYGAIPYLGDFDRLFKPITFQAYENEK